MWEVMRKTRVIDSDPNSSEEYALPYHTDVGPDPSFEEMRKVVCTALRRPDNSDKWMQNTVSNCAIVLIMTLSLIIRRPRAGSILIYILLFSICSLWPAWHLWCSSAGTRNLQYDTLDSVWKNLYTILKVPVLKVCPGEPQVHPEVLGLFMYHRQRSTKVTHPSLNPLVAKKSLYLKYTTYKKVYMILLL